MSRANVILKDYWISKVKKLENEYGNDYLSKK